MHNRDVKLAEEDNSYLVYTADMKKVDQLPEIPALQEAFFNSGVVSYNETFCPSGPNSADNPTFFALWNESVSARDSPDVASAFWAFFEELAAKAERAEITLDRNGKVHIILWVDNCVPQVLRMSYNADFFSN